MWMLMPTTSQSSLASLTEAYEKNRSTIEKRLVDFLSFPSISADPKFALELNACKTWLMKLLQEVGLQVEEWPTSGHPVVFASYMGAGPSKPTILIYSHYDVQPVEPLSEWTTPPFEPTIRNGNIYARGANDDKGQCLYVIEAIRALLERDGKLPVNVKLCIEAEEEMGSLGLAQIIPHKKKELAADTLIVVDFDLNGPDIPTVSLGFRGIITMDVEVDCATTDTHSGSYGGVLYNPNHALIEILAKMRDKNGKVTVPGFYDDVKEIGPEDRKQICFDLDHAEFEKSFGTQPTGGEKDFSPLESSWTRPTLEVNGIGGGYIGTGFKTAIPAKAIAKVSCRLVPDQDPQKIAEEVASYMKSLAPKGVKIDVQIHGATRALRTTGSSQGNKAMAQAFSEVLGKPCIFNLSGGSIPVIATLAEATKTDVVLMGYRLANDGMHAPNECFGLNRMKQGYLTIARALEILGELNP